MPSPSTAIGAPSAAVIAAAVHGAMARARENDVTTIAFPALGTGVGGFPLDEAARITLAAVRDELARSPLDRGRHVRPARSGRLRRLPGGPQRAPADATAEAPSSRRRPRAPSDDAAARADRGAARRAGRPRRPGDPPARPGRPGGLLPERQPAVSAAGQQRHALLRPDAPRPLRGEVSSATSSWPTTSGSSS